MREWEIWSELDERRGHFTRPWGMSNIATKDLEGKGLPPGLTEAGQEWSKFIRGVRTVGHSRSTDVGLWARGGRVIIKDTAVKMDWKQTVDDLKSPAKTVGFLLEQTGLTEGFQHKNWNEHICFTKRTLAIQRNTGRQTQRLEAGQSVKRPIRQCKRGDLAPQRRRWIKDSLVLTSAEWVYNTFVIYNSI